ncbi:MAG: DUF6206 family protein [Anaerolineae bacterium]|jgi:hypothetical protein|nr:DUF6206 family protein [Anaerolineae bacterium]
MTSPTVDMQLLARFEAGLDLRRPEQGVVPARVLHHGEMSTIMTIGGKGAPALVYKRLPAFLTPDEAGYYESLHRRYVKTLGERAGVKVASSTAVRVLDASKRFPVVYIVQELIPEDAVCHMATYRMSPPDVGRLVMGILNETAKVFDLNRHGGDTEIGFDADMSNWAIAGYDADRGGLPDRFKLLFLDTNTPLMRRNGHELFDVEPFLRPAPAPLLPVIRRAVLPDLMSRYYDFRRIAIELVGRFYDEGRIELVSGMVDAVNWFFLAERRENHFQPVTVDEVRRFHRWDRFIWRAFTLACRVDRRMKYAGRRPYPYILPARRRA